jgi:monoamine oxidase
MTPGRVIVVGAGAAGLMAAGQAASLGASLLLEKMDRPGRKLLLTGKGRCNLTNADSLPEFIEHFGPNGRFCARHLPGSSLLSCSISFPLWASPASENAAGAISYPAGAPTRL